MVDCDLANFASAILPEWYVTNCTMTAPTSAHTTPADMLAAAAIAVVDHAYSPAAAVGGHPHTPEAASYARQAAARAAAAAGAVLTSLPATAVTPTALSAAFGGVDSVPIEEAVRDSTAVATSSSSVASASSSSSGESETSPFQMSYVADVTWTLVFSVMIVSAILGNLVVFWIVLGTGFY